MTAPVLAPAPVLLTGTGPGANTGPTRAQGHRYHPLGETRMGNQEVWEGGCAADCVRSRPLSPSCPAASRQHDPRRRQ
jgi:hypothetical protein